MSRRFFTMLGTLIGGRIAIGLAALSATKLAQTIAIRYTLRRLQFDPLDTTETLLLDYPTQQRRLLPGLTRTYAIDFALKDLLRTYATRTETGMREIETLAAVLKTFRSWHATIQRFGSRGLRPYVDSPIHRGIHKCCIHR